MRVFAVNGLITTRPVPRTARRHRPRRGPRLGLLDADDHDVVEAALRGWDCAHPPLAPDGCPDHRERPAARPALLAALAPYRIADEDVAAWRRPEHTDHCLVHLVAYGAFIAMDRVESALSAQNILEAP
ncbi:hypothetical protein [Streptomyces sp. NPDC093568]|uniref:hypothetical protein n=1 Tax=Streptomyces sp. NPDC093568 TaxID=3366041 RepID=UPI003821D298